MSKGAQKGATGRLRQQGHEPSQPAVRFRYQHARGPWSSQSNGKSFDPARSATDAHTLSSPASTFTRCALSSRLSPSSAAHFCKSILMSVLAALRPRGLLRNARALTTSNVASSSSAPVQVAYDVPRNSKGSLPVYNDIRNGGTRHLTLIRNVEGNASVCPPSPVPPAHTDHNQLLFVAQRLADDIQKTLFPADSSEAARLKIRVHQNRHLILSGGRWKHSVVEWLSAKGF